MLMSLKAASVGLNLVCANHVILLDIWWNPTVEDQVGGTQCVHPKLRFAICTALPTGAAPRLRSKNTSKIGGHAPIMWNAPRPILHSDRDRLGSLLSRCNLMVRSPGTGLCLAYVRERGRQQPASSVLCTALLAPKQVLVWCSLH